MCTHKAASELISSSLFLEALCVAGPMLKANSADLTAWYLVAQALMGLGETESALKNLKSLVVAVAEQRRPVLALALIKEIEDSGEEIEDLARKLAKMYGAGSNRVEESQMSPPPLPSLVPVDRWDASKDQNELVDMAKQAMAVAWGESLASIDKEGSLPYVPLLSALAPKDFVLLVETFIRQVFTPGEVIIEQDAVGDAIYVVAQGEVEIVRRLKNGETRELARLSPGAFFGEMAIVSCAPRVAEAVAKEHTVVLRAKRENIDALCERTKEISEVLIAFCHARMLENLIRVSPVLSLVPTLRRPELVALFDTNYFESNSVIIEEGGEAPGLFLIVSGGVDVVRKEKNDRVIVASLGPGDIFGEISLLMQRQSTATVIAREDTAVLFLLADQFHEVTKEFPELLKGAFDIALAREAKNNSILASEEAAADDLVLL